MSGAAAGAAIGGSFLGVYGALKSASDEADMLEENKRLANEQADELEYREMVNEIARNQAAFKAELNFGSGYAATGREGTGIGSQLEIHRQVQVQNEISSREAQYEAAAIRAGGSYYGKMAENLSRFFLTNTLNLKKVQRYLAAEKFAKLLGMRAGRLFGF